MSKITSGKFACCALILAIVMLSLYPQDNFTVASVAIAKNEVNPADSIQTITHTQFNSGEPASSSFNYDNQTIYNNNSNVAINIGVVDITQTQIPIPSSSSSTSISTFTIPKTPGIELEYANDIITVIIDAYNIKSFKLYKAINGGSYSEVCFAAGSTYKDSNISDGNVYSYKALCAREDGTSVYSSSNSITIEKLKALTGVTAQCKLGEIKLFWQVVNDAKYYTIYRKEDGTLKKITTVNGETFTNISLMANTSYTYLIDARDSSGNRIAISSESSFKTLYLPSALELRLYSNDEYGIEIAWPPDSYALSYNVYKYISGEYVLVKNTKTNYYIDASASGSCSYVVCAIGSAGEGAKSNIISVVSEK